MDKKKKLDIFDYIKKFIGITVDNETKEDESKNNKLQITSKAAEHNIEGNRKPKQKLEISKANQLNFNGTNNAEEKDKYIKNLMSTPEVLNYSKMPELYYGIELAAKDLWDAGYKNLKFLASGKYNVVFEKNQNTVVKWCKRDPNRKDGLSFDEMSLREFEKMLKTTKDTELSKWADKYLSKVERKNQKNIYEADKAIGDANDGVGKRRTKFRQIEWTNGTKTIDTVLRNGSALCKALHVMHESGYVHQDVKPANIFKIKAKTNVDLDNQIGKEQTDKKGKYKIIKEGIRNKEKYYKEYLDGELKGKKKQIHKNRLQLGDMGTMRKIDEILNNKEVQKQGTLIFESQESRSTPPQDKNDVCARDLYAAGLTILELLVGECFFNVLGGKNIAPYQAAQNNCYPWFNFKTDSLNLDNTEQSNCLNILQNNYYSSLWKIYDYNKEFWRVAKLLKLIYIMTAPKTMRGDMTVKKAAEILKQI